MQNHTKVTPKPSIERTSKKLRRLAAAHVERWASQASIALDSAVGGAYAVRP
jgi:hypothetical protein